ncbi:MAG: hypothetical protein EBU84_05245 [Actinobacteria bacterium]|nr:hypothetical protein [Actinomycetota bacterium]
MDEYGAPPAKMQCTSTKDVRCTHYTGDVDDGPVEMWHAESNSPKKEQTSSSGVNKTPEDEEIFASECKSQDRSLSDRINPSGSITRQPGDAMSSVTGQIEPQDDILDEVELQEEEMCCDESADPQPTDTHPIPASTFDAFISAFKDCYMQDKNPNTVIVSWTPLSVYGEEPGNHESMALALDDRTFSTLLNLPTNQKSILCFSEKRDVMTVIINLCMNAMSLFKRFRKWDGEIGDLYSAMAVHREDELGDCITECLDDIAKLGISVSAWYPIINDESMFGPATLTRSLIGIPFIYRSIYINE